MDGKSDYWNYANSFTYNAAGAVTSMQLGNGRWESTQFNSRLQPTQIALGATNGATNLLKLDYSYGTTANNGNIMSQTITVPTVGVNAGFTAIQNYTYDSLNRINDATENVTPHGGSSSQSWKQAFTYDRYGNRNFDEEETTTLPKACLNGVDPVVCAADRKIVNPSVNTANNRLSSSDDYVFDSSGNTTRDAQNRKFTYDAENKQIKVETVDGNGDPIATIGEYFYDGDGRRIKKIVPNTGEVTVFVYDGSGKLIAEYSTVVTASNDAKVAFLTNDHLGSPRINTDQDGTVTARHDYHPFGEEIYTSERTVALNYSADTIRKQFTGYERDTETNLDFAQSRHFDSNFGRFSTPDSFTNATRSSDPQTWNLYAYVTNNPLKFVDPLGKKGEVSWYTDDDGIVRIKVKASFAIYGASGQNVSKEDLKTYKKALERGIKELLTKQGVLGSGERFSMTTDISAKVYKDEATAIKSGRDNIVELGYSSLETPRGSAAATSFGVQGESFDRMAVSIDQNPATDGGPFSPLEQTEILFAHEFAAHLLYVLHGKNDKSLFYGGEVLTYGTAIDQTDMKRLMYGYDDSSYTQPPPARGEKYIPQDAPYPPLGSGSRQHFAHSRNNSTPSDVYRWVKNVNR